MMLDASLMLPLAFFLIAFIYSLVGFAGGSSYLLLLALAGVSTAYIPQIALICNLVVSAVAFYHFKKNQDFRWKKALPFIAFSVPMAFFGAKIPLSHSWFCALLAVALFCAAFRIFFSKPIGGAVDIETDPKKLMVVGLPIGAGIGFLSGLLGIGGGVFLAPILILMRWVSVKETAAIVSLFIFLNSLSGFVSRFGQGFAWRDEYFALILCALMGGFLGSRVGSMQKWPRIYLERALALLLMYLSSTLFMKAF